MADANPRQVEILLGGMTPPLHEQLGVPAEDVAKYQRALESLNYLRIHGFLPASIAWKRSEMAMARMLKDLEKQARTRDRDGGRNQ